MSKYHYHISFSYRLQIIGRHADIFDAPLFNGDLNYSTNNQIKVSPSEACMYEVVDREIDIQCQSLLGLEKGTYNVFLATILWMKEYP